MDNNQVIEALKSGGVVVMPTDTLYGVVADALNAPLVERIYDLRKRTTTKPCIILIGDTRELEKFSITLTEKQESKIKEFWPGPVSIILDCPSEKFSYLHRGTNTLAFRLPGPQAIREILLETGSLIAPSANIEGQDPARSIEEAKKYFGDQVDLYVDGGIIVGKASQIIKLDQDGSAHVVRA